MKQIVFAMVLLLSSPTIWALMKQCQFESDPLIARIGILYRQGTYEGSKLWDVAKNAEPPKHVEVCLVQFPYATENDGFEQLLKIRDLEGQNKIHIIIGPTDTGVYTFHAQEHPIFPSII